MFLAAAKAFRTKLYAGKRKRRILQCLDLTEEEVDLITPNDKVSAPHAEAAPAGRGADRRPVNQETNFHVVEMKKVRFDQMEAIAKYWRNRYDAVIGFLPTGWCVARPGGASHQGKQKQATLTANAQVSRARAQMGRRRASKSMVIYEVRTPAGGGAGPTTPSLTDARRTAQVPYSEHSSFYEQREFVAWLQPREVIPSVGNDRGPKAAEMVRRLTEGKENARAA